MASCCTGVTECDQVITIGFLNSFIGSDVQDSNGAAQTAAGNSDYCPTYSELTGGSLIQNWEQGTTPNGDKDGIIIGGSYASDECVRRSDLSMKFTRFKEFSISAASTTLSACSASTTISYTHKYDRCERKINSACEAAAADSCTAVNDTQNSEVTLTSSNTNFTLNGFTVNVPKNNPSGNGRSNSRNTTITGKITFRGTDHTATVKITQSGLSGKYVYYYSDYSITNKRTVCTGSTFDCSGGDYKAQALQTRTDWDVYNWKDNCGENYYSDTSGTNYTSYTQTAYTYSGSFSDKSGECGTWEDSASWAGYGTGCSWKQTCAECDCEDYTSWGEGTYSGTVPCSGGTVYMTNITIPGTIHYRHIDEETSACVETTTATSKSASTNVYISCNTDRTSKTHTGISNGIRYTITQSAGPCCTPNATTSYTPQYLSCSAHENEAVSSTYTARTTGECCNTSSTTGRTSTYYVTVGCNSGNTRVVESDAPFTIYQYGDTACCITCKCENVNLNATVTAAGSSMPASGYTNLTVIGTYDNTTCLSSITATSSSAWVTNISVSNGNVSAKVQQNGNLESGRTAVITVTGKDGFNADCYDTFEVSQTKSASTCTCASITFQADATAAGSSIPAEGYSTSTAIGEYTYPTCLTGVTASSDVNWVTITNVSNGSVYATVNENEDTDNSRSGTVTVSGVDAYGETCSDPFDVSQAKSAITCTCDSLTLSPTALTWEANATTSDTKVININKLPCHNNITASDTTHFKVTVGTNTIIVAPKQANTGASINDTLIISYNAYSTSCSAQVTLSQEAGCETGVTQIAVEKTKDCNAIATDITSCDISQKIYETKLINGVCTTTEIWQGAMGKTVYCTNNPVPANTSTTQVTRDYSLYYVITGTTTGQFFNYNPGGNAYAVGTLKLTQDPCGPTPTCNPGTDNNGKNHPIMFDASTMISESDMYINGMTDACYGGASYDAVKSEAYRMTFSESQNYLIGDFITTTLPGADYGVHYRASVNTSWKPRVAVYSLSNTCPDNGICSTWDVFFIQGGNTSCPCTSLNWDISTSDDLSNISNAGGVYKVAYINTSNGCIDELTIYWGSVGQITPPSWITIESVPPIGTAGYINIRVASNTTGEERSTTFFLSYTTTTFITECPEKERDVRQTG